MRRVVFLSLGVLELVAAGLLVAFGLEASPREVEEGFLKAEQVTHQASRQVGLVRRQVQGMDRPELREMAGRLRDQARAASDALKAQQIDYDTVRAMADALGDVAAGLDGVARTLTADDFGRVGDGLGETAAFLEKVIPAAARAADDLDATAAGLRDDARRLNALLRDAPLDLKAAREVYTGLGRFGEGLAQLDGRLRADRLDRMREGFRGMQSALTTGAEQVERLSDYTYPAVSLKGLRPEVTQRPFWPEGETIAKGLRKAADGVAAADQEVDGLTRDLPNLRATLDESRKAVERTRAALGTALQQQDKLEPLLRDLPGKTAALAERLPAAAADLARVLRDTGRLREVAAGLRQAQRAAADVRARQPELRRSLTRTAVVLKSARGQLDQVLRQRAQYEAARQQAASLGDAFATLLPAVTDDVSGQFHEQDRALGDLGRSIDEVGGLMPVYGRTMARLLRAGQLLAWLAAAVVGLHGAYLVVGAAAGRRYSP